MPAPRRRKPEADASASPSPPRLSKAERRRGILLLAKPVLCRVGYADLTLEQVAQASGLPLARLTQYFADKPSLLAGWFDLLYQSIFVIPDSDPPPAPLDATAALHAMGRRFLSTLRTEAGLLRVLIGLINVPPDAETRSVVEAWCARAVDAVLDLLHQGQSEGVIRRSLDARATAWDWLRFLMGFALLRSFHPPLPAESDPVAHLLESLLHGVVKTDI